MLFRFQYPDIKLEFVSVCLGLSAESAVSHRLYDLEVIDVSDDVTFLLLLPPADSVCSVPGNRQQLTNKPGYITLPIKVFEMSE